MGSAGERAVQARVVVEERGDGFLGAGHAVDLAGALDDVELVGGVGVAAVVRLRRRRSEC